MKIPVSGRKPESRHRQMFPVSLVFGLSPRRSCRRIGTGWSFAETDFVGEPRGSYSCLRLLEGSIRSASRYFATVLRAMRTLASSANISEILSSL